MMLTTLFMFVYPWKWLLKKGTAVKLKSLRYSEDTAKEMYPLLKNHPCSEGKINSVLTKLGGCQRDSPSQTQGRDCLEATAVLTMSKVKRSGMTACSRITAKSQQ